MFFDSFIKGNYSLIVLNEDKEVILLTSKFGSGLLYRRESHGDVLVKSS